MKIIMANLISITSVEEIDYLTRQFEEVASQVELSSIPPYNYYSLKFQLLTGLQPEKTGVFDKIRIDNYRIKQTETFEELDRALVWNVVKSMGKVSTTKWADSEEMTDLVYLEKDSIVIRK